MGEEIVPKQCFSALVNDCPTEFVVMEYVNQILVIATQIGKLGTLLQARYVIEVSRPLQDSSATPHVHVTRGSPSLVPILLLQSLPAPVFPFDMQPPPRELPSLPELDSFA